MKKLVFLTLNALFLMSSVNVLIAKTDFVKNIDLSNSEVKAVSEQTIPVMKIVRQSAAWIKVKTSGQYNSESNMITIGRYSYSVKKNPYYGGEKSGGRENFEYYAGGEYFFNL